MKMNLEGVSVEIEPAPLYVSSTPVSSQWQPIETAPKDGTRILAYGTAPEEILRRGEELATYDTNSKWVPFTRIIFWVERWYDKEIEVGDGLYKKERTQGYGYFRPNFGFRAIHWMPLPEPPKETP